MKSTQKKFVKIFLAATFLILFFTPFLSKAITADEKARCDQLQNSLKIEGLPTDNNNPLFQNGNLAQGLPSYCTANELLQNAINIALAFAGSVAVLFLIVGGFWYLTAAGNEEQAEKGRKTLVNSIIGLIVIIMSFAIVRIVSNALTGGSSGTGTGNNTSSSSGSNNLPPTEESLPLSEGIDIIFDGANVKVTSTINGASQISSAEKFCNNASSMDNVKLVLYFDDQPVDYTTYARLEETKYEAQISWPAKGSGTVKAKICDVPLDQENIVVGNGN